MKLNSLFSLFSSNNSESSPQVHKNDTSEQAQSTISESSAPLEEPLNTSESNEMLFESEELDSFIETPLSSQHELTEIIQAEEVKEDILVNEPFHIDESDPNRLLELD